MARIVPPAVSRTQEILSRVCMCTNVRQKETGKVTAHGLAQGASAVGVWFVSGGFAPLERQKCCWNWIAQVAAVWGSEEETEEQQLYNWVYATLYLLSPPSQRRVTAARRDPKGKRTHLLSTSKRSLKPCCRWLRVAGPHCAQRKSLSTQQRKAPHAWSGRIATNDTTQPQRDTSGTELCTERCHLKTEKGPTNVQALQFFPDLWFTWKGSTASHYLNTQRWWVCVKINPGLLCVYTDSWVLLLSSLVNRFKILRGIHTRQRKDQSWRAIDTLPSLPLTLPFNCCSKAIKTHKELQSDLNLDHTSAASNILRFRIALFCETWAAFSMVTLEKSLHQSRSKHSWCKNTHY